MALWFFSILLIIFSLLCSHGTSSNQEQGRRTASYTWNTTFQQMNQGLLFRRGAKGSVTLQPGTLGYYMGNSSRLNSTGSGWFVIPKLFDPLKTSPEDDRIDLQEASFTVVFTLSFVSTTSTPLLFDILPRLEPSPSIELKYRRPQPVITIYTLDNTTFHSGRTIRVRIITDFLPPERHNPNNPPPAPERYSVQISYDPAAHNLSVYLARDVVGTQVPVNITRHLDDMDALSPDRLIFALSATMGQLMRLHTWNFTIEVPVTEDSQGANTTVTILSSVLGSAASAAAIAAAVYLYLNSKYRRWKKDLGQLAKSMQRLPGVPMKVDFADIKKATNNFHETTRLGQGGFGAVFRCRLAAPNKGDSIEVAVKKFTRADNRCYEDFLAEVSIINRLRHKNIVPLVGWSYNKGEPILIYEYMPNGSLDQLLFNRNGDEQQLLPTSICQWSTRYSIYEPMVLHRDIKASNILIDLTFQARLGDFGLACVLADGKNSYTDQGAPGTIGFRAPEYIYSGKATRKTDVFAFGVLVLEIVTGKKAVGRDVVQFGGHIMDWVWHLHAEGNLLAAVDAVVLTAPGGFDVEEAVRLLLLGMACSHPNPSDRPSMADVVRIIGKSAPPPDMPLSKPPVMWPPEELTSDDSNDGTLTTSNLKRTSAFMLETTTGRRREHSISSENDRGGSSLTEIARITLLRNYLHGVNLFADRGAAIKRYAATGNDAAIFAT
ncbi:hypothetical protein BS78_08G090500 [Paspalum vaginatum]|nr:hypothetical protein BS78_08G090500 [Paspalum vaginatum]